MCFKEQGDSKTYGIPYVWRALEIITRYRADNRVFMGFVLALIFYIEFSIEKSDRVLKG